ncbi:hypothetical protein GIB67_019001 [Kingdonia uniflora]|uniref:Myb/SANT-like domain-containing protein n=1 Tax=Kingdonia uniflora TaxID=39325 RepID=A0A7J7MZQ8_9MAGN|nr:hypothetical protein GIB67_019001 [Kingdonia uniflora]
MTLDQPSLPPFEVAKESTTADWSQEQELFFIGLMVDKVIARGEKKGKGMFSKANWLDTRKKYYQRWGLKYKLKAFKNKMNNLREQFKEFKKLVEGSSGLGWDPLLGNLSAPNSWWDDYIETNPKAKRFRNHCCPEYENLEVIFGGTIAIGHLQSASSHEINSTDEKDILNEGLAESFPPSPFSTTPMEASPISKAPMVGTSTDNATGVDEQGRNVQHQLRTCSRTRTNNGRRRRKDNTASELSELLKMFAEASQAREELRNKYTMSECVEILDSMGPVVEMRTYMRAIRLLQEKGWREAFICMPDERRKGWLQSIDAGII